MKHTNKFAKAMLLIIALAFTSSAQAGGNVNFSFSVQVNGGHQAQHQTIHPNNQFFNSFFGNNQHQFQNNQGGFRFIFGNQNQQPHKAHFKTIKNKKKLTKYLRSAGLRHIRNVKRQGKFYTARAVTRHGKKVKVRVNRFTGRIVIKRANKWRVYK